MDKEKDIIDRIVKNASEKAESLISLAKKNASESFILAKQQIVEEKKEALVKAKELIRVEKEQRDRLVSLDQRKEELEKRRKVVDSVFAEAEKELLSMKDKDYKALIKKITTKYAKPGDTIVTSKKNDGIIIRNKKYDLVFTFDKMLTALRLEIESEVAGLLYE